MHEVARKRVLHGLLCNIKLPLSMPVVCIVSTKCNFDDKFRIDENLFWYMASVNLL